MPASPAASGGRIGGLGAGSLARSGVGTLRAYAIVAALLLVWAAFWWATDGAFASPRNLSNLARQSAVTGLLAVGMTLVIVSGNIDLSVGSLVGLAGGVAAMLSTQSALPLPVALVGALALGAGIGLVQGAAVAYLRVPAFIVTLAGLLVWRGAIKGLTGGETIGPVPAGFGAIGQSYLAPATGWILAGTALLALYTGLWRSHAGRRAHDPDGAGGWTAPAIAAVTGTVVVVVAVATLNGYAGLPLPVLVVAAVALVFHGLAARTTFGRRVYAIGGNPDAAYLSGIDIRANTLAVFGLMGVLAAVAGVVYTARVGSATADAGNVLELDAIAACVIGGTSLLGGRGTVAGALVGALIMASLDNGMSLLNVQDYVQDVVKGLILLVAVWADVASKRGR